MWLKTKTIRLTDCFASSSLTKVQRKGWGQELAPLERTDGREVGGEQVLQDVEDIHSLRRQTDQRGGLAVQPLHRNSTAEFRTNDRPVDEPVRVVTGALGNCQIDAASLVDQRDRALLFDCFTDRSRRRQHGDRRNRKNVAGILQRAQILQHVESVPILDEDVGRLRGVYVFPRNAAEPLAEDPVRNVLRNEVVKCDVHNVRTWRVYHREFALTLDSHTHGSGRSLRLQPEGEDKLPAGPDCQEEAKECEEAVKGSHRPPFRLEHRRAYEHRRTH